MASLRGARTARLSTSGAPPVVHDVPRRGPDVRGVAGLYQTGLPSMLSPLTRQTIPTTVPYSSEPIAR